MKKQYQKLWHDIAVGMFYREQSAENPKDYRHWEQCSLCLKLHYQAKAKKELAALIEATGGFHVC